MSEEQPAPQSPEYLAAWVHERLAEDDRLHEQGIQVLLDGDVLVLTGTLATPERVAMAEAVAHEVAPGAVVRNELAVLDLHPPVAPEAVS